jgi:hypothetical protein
MLAKFGGCSSSSNSSNYGYFGSSFSNDFYPYFKPLLGYYLRDLGEREPLDFTKVVVVAYFSNFWL